MKLVHFIRQDELDTQKGQKASERIQQIISELENHELPDTAVNAINAEMKKLNGAPASGRKLRHAVYRTGERILRMCKKEAGLVAKHHYRNTWLSFGMSAIGIPLGIVLGVLIYDGLMIGLGLPLALPIGMLIGILLGDREDKKVFKAGKQLDVETL